MKKCPNCGLLNPTTAQRCDCGWDFASGQKKKPYRDLERTERGDSRRTADIQQELDRLNRKSLALALVGFVLQGVGRGLADGAGVLLIFVGAGFFVAGLASYARMRGQSPAFGLLGLLSCLGFLILYFLPKQCLDCQTSHSYRAKQCKRCGAPLGA